MQCTTGRDGEGRLAGSVNACTFGIFGVMLCFLVGCTDPATMQNPAGSPAPCPSGHTTGPKGECMPVGIQGCADIFLEDDGLCHPSTDKCPIGTIPKFKEGCVPVGIQGCADIFMEEDGLCHPSMDKCPAGTIPKFDKGCVRLGIPDCPPEFIESDGLCHPRMAKCPLGMFAQPQKGCASIDGPPGCGTGTWGNLADGPGTVYVDPAYPGADSEGSKAKPVHTIAAAMPLAAAGGRVVLAAGIYPEGVTITKAVTLEGRCASMVRIEGTVDALGFPTAVWVSSTAGVTLRNLQIGGAGIGIMGYQSPALTIDHVRVQKATRLGVYASGASTQATISNSWIDGTLPDPSNKTLGHGMEVSGGAQVTMNDTAVVGNRYSGVRVKVTGSKLTATGSLIEGTLSQESDKGYGQGIDVSSGAVVELNGGAVVYNRTTGIVVDSSKSTVIATGNLIEGTLARESDQQDGTGILVTGGARAALDANVILENRSEGLLAESVSSEVTAIGNLIAGTRPQAQSGTFGLGAVIVGAKATLEDNAIVENRMGGVLIIGPGTDAAVRGCLIQDTLPRVLDARDGHGILVETHALAMLDGNAIIDSASSGIVLEDDANATVMRNLIQGTMPPGGMSKDPSSAGIRVAGATVVLNGNAIHENRMFGLLAGGNGASLTASTNLIERTLSMEDDPSLGIGVQVSEGARAMLSDNTIRENRTVGLVVSDPGTDVTAATNLIEDTLAQEVDQRWGMGVEVREGGKLELAESAVVGNRNAGVFVDGIASTAVVAGCVIDGTLAQQSDGAAGVGLVCQSAAYCTVTSSFVGRSRGVAMLVADGAALDAQASVIKYVLAGKLKVAGAMMTAYEGIGDGILVDKSSANVTQVRVQACARAGILFNDSGGSVGASASIQNAFGLVLQGSPQPSYGEPDSTFAPNTWESILTGGSLSIPDKLLAAVW